MNIEHDEIRKAVQAGRMIIRRHARRRKAQRKIYHWEIKNVLLHGQIIEESPKSKPFPKCLIMDFVRNHEPLYVSCSFDGSYVYIITVHWYDPQKWINPWTRKRSNKP